MPRRRRIEKRRRLDRFEGAEAWADVFRSGRAMFDDFPMETGVAMDRGGCVASEDARAAWNTYGPTFLAQHGREGPRGRGLWALKQFGEPNAGA